MKTAKDYWMCVEQRHVDKIIYIMSNRASELTKIADRWEKENLEGLEMELREEAAAWWTVISILGDVRSGEISHE